MNFQQDIVNIYKFPLRMKKKYFFLALLMPLLAVSQQDVQFSQFMFNRIYYNPGVAGSGGAICINGLHRSQWVGFEGAPVSTNLNANIPIRGIGGGIGVNIVSDQIGYFNDVSAGLSYAYQLDLARGTLGFGLGATFLNRGLANAVWQTPDQGGMIPGSIDPQLPAGNASGFQVDLDFGLYYQDNNIWAGVSSTRMIENTVEVDNQIDIGNTFFRNARHYYAMGGYNWAIPASNWEFRPSFLVKMAPGGANTFDINAMGVYNNQIWGGVTYRLQDAIVAMLGYQVMPSLRIGYSYDIGTSALAGETGGSHEVFVSYCFKIEIPPRMKGSYKNPRFL